MNYLFGLSRRWARLRTGCVIAASLVASLSCANDDPNGPGSGISSNDPTRLWIAPDSVAVAVNQAVQFEATLDSTSLSAYRRTKGRWKRSSIVDVNITPQTLTVAEGSAASFTATAALSDGSTTEPSVTWVATGGTIDGNGKYTAGASAGQYNVIARAANGIADTAAVNVSESAPTVAQIALSPTSASLPIGGSKRFTAVGKSTTGVTVPITPSYAATGGTVSSDGMYQAGQTAGTFRVIATDTTTGEADTSAVTITPPAAVLQALVLTPASSALQAGATQQFAVAGHMSDGSTTTVSATYSASGGTITSGGLYTAGQTAGAFRVIATQSGGTLADTAQVTVSVPPSPPSPPSTTDCLSSATVCAGPALSGSVNQAIPLAGRAPAGQKVFWTKISGPGEARFAHEMFDASFEDGTVNEWIGDGGGGQAGGGYVTTEQAAHSGTHTWKAYNDPAITDATLRFSAKLLRNRFDIATGYYSAWYWFPTGYASGYDNIFQFKEDANGVYDPTWIVIARNGFFGIHDYQGGSGITATSTPVPTGRWVNITAYLKASKTAGELIVWVDGKVIFNRSGINTLGKAATLMWGVGNYGSDQVGKSIYVDDTEVSDAAAYPNASTTSATFSAPGVYVLRLTASDGQQSMSDDVQVTVR